MSVPVRETVYCCIHRGIVHTVDGDSSMRRGIVRFSTRVFGIDGMREMFVEDAGVYDYTSIYVSMHEYLHIDVIYTDIYSHTWSPG